MMVMGTRVRPSVSQSTTQTQIRTPDNTIDTDLVEGVLDGDDGVLGRQVLVEVRELRARQHLLPVPAGVLLGRVSGRVG